MERKTKKRMKSLDKCNVIPTFKKINWVNFKKEKIDRSCTLGITEISIHGVPENQNKSTYNSTLKTLPEQVHINVKEEDKKAQ